MLRSLNNVLLIAVIAVSVLLSIGACSSIDAPSLTNTVGNEDPSPATTTADYGGIEVVIDDAGNFSPGQITINPGDTITWINEDDVSHTITSWKQYTDSDGWRYTEIGKLWDSGDIQPGNSYSQTFTEIGRYEYSSFSMYLYIEFQLQSVGIVIVSERVAG